MNVKKIVNPILLTLAALIWGVAFVAQKNGAEYVKPFTVISVRSFIAALALIPVILIMGKKAPQPICGKGDRKTLVKGGVLCGIALFTASFFQQWGIDAGTDSGRAGFITALYIIIVAIIGMCLKRKVNWKIIVAVLSAITGLYLLCVTGGFTVAVSDLLVLVCALLFAGHILIIDYFSPRTECVKMACIQFFVCGVLGIFGIILSGEAPTLQDIWMAKIPLLYLGVMSSGIAYTLQIVGQRGTDPTLASILMSLESVFAVLAGLLFGETINQRQALGCILMFGAIILSQIPDRRKS